MTEIRHAHSATHTVADAHGRHVDFTLTGATPTHCSPCARPVIGARSRGRPGAVVIRLAAILAAGLVVSVLLVVIRDIAITVANTGLTGLVVKALLTSSNRRDR
jgi:hypothetical protein